MLLPTRVGRLFSLSICKLFAVPLGTVKSVIEILIFIFFSKKKIVICKLFALWKFLKIWAFKGASHWYLNENKKIVLPYYFT